MSKHSSLLERTTGRREEGNGEPSEAMEGGVRQVVAIVVQDMQERHRQRGAPPRQDGPSHPIRRLHARIFLLLLFPPISFLGLAS